MAGLALKHGVNANLLRKWIKLHQQRLADSATESATEAAFVPVVTIPTEHALAERKAAMPVSPAADRAAVSTLTVQMPNGVTLKLECVGNDVSLLSAMIETLGRCDVPAAR